MVQEVPVLGRLITELPAGAALDYEVHQAIDAATMYLVSAGEPASVLPVYVPREQDAELAPRVKQVLAGESAIVTLVGESSTGKTRTFWEVLQALPAGWRVWHPLRPDEPGALLTGVDTITPQTVVWLNEAQRYLLIPDNNRGEEVAAALRELLRHPARGPVLILATLWPKYWDALTVDHVAGQPDPHAQARALLSGTDIFVPIGFTKQDLEKVRTAAAEDWRLEEALEQAEDGQITQYLAGAPQLLQRYRNAPRPAQALIEAAMDLRRLGHGPALPLALLAAATPSYLSDQEWDEAGDDWLEQALAYTARPCRGARGPLTRIRPRPGQPAHDQPLYRLAAYLEQVGRIDRWLVVPPTGFWLAATESSAPDDAARLGLAAENRGRIRLASHLYERAALAGNSSALVGLVRIRDWLGDTAGANQVAERFAATGDTDALVALAGIRLDSGDLTGAQRLYERAAAAGNTDALIAQAVLREQVGDLDGAQRLCQQAAAAANPGTLITLAEIRERAGDAAGAEHAAQIASDTGDLDPMIELGLMREKAGDVAEAQRLYRQAAVLGCTSGFTLLAEALEDSGDTEGANQAIQKCAELGDFIGLIELARLRTRAGNLSGAEELYHQAMDMGCIFAWTDLAELREQAGDLAAAEHLYQEAIEAGSTYALERLARIRESAGNLIDAHRLLQYIPDSGHALLAREGPRYGWEPDGTESDPW
jgi:hypothetical protein